MGWRLAAGPQVENGPESGVPKYAGRNVTAAADGNHKVWLEVIENAICGCLAEFVNLQFATLANPSPLHSLSMPFVRIFNLRLGGGTSKWEGGAEGSGMLVCDLKDALANDLE